MNFPVAKLIQLLEPDQWEEVTEEWAHSLEPSYKEVIKFGGSGDLGRDIVGLSSDKAFDGPWDNYQCKRYGKKLMPSDVWAELGKIIYYSYTGEYVPPQNCYFMASKGIGTKLKTFLTRPKELKQGLLDNWDKHCKKEITETKEIPLEGSLLEYVENFDFNIFKMISIVKMLKGYSNTPFYNRRFDTASFPERPAVELPPDEVQEKESRYIEQLFEAYSEKLSSKLETPEQLEEHPDLKQHFDRAREIFYHAESLRSFARDSVDPGTFAAVQQEIYHGVVNTYEMDFVNGFTRMGQTIQQAGNVNPTCNALCIRVQTQDKQGLCHHPANEDRFIWVKKKNG